MQAISDANLREGFNKVYDRNLAKSLRRIYTQHSHLFAGIGGDYQPELAANCKTIREFDDAITRVSFGKTCQQRCTVTLCTVFQDKVLNIF